MLIPAKDGPAIVACNTCRHSTEAQNDTEGVRGGARMVAALRTAQQAESRYAGIAVQEMPCLMSCSEFCSVLVRAPGKLGYVLGRFTPSEEAATALLDYAVLHAASEHGRVPFKEWPKGVKGHFICRTPPPGFVTE